MSGLVTHLLRLQQQVWSSTKTLAHVCICIHPYNRYSTSAVCIRMLTSLVRERMRKYAESFQRSSQKVVRVLREVTGGYDHFICCQDMRERSVHIWLLISVHQAIL